MDTTGQPSLSQLYRDSRERVVALVAPLDDGALDSAVPTCPGWSVRDVVAHLTAVVEDVLAGRLTGPPSDEQTSDQVARFAGRAFPEILALWAEKAPPFEELVDAFEVWPAVLDVATHEHDIRGAISRPGSRDTVAVRLGADRLINLLSPPVPLRVTVEDAEFRLGPDNGDEVLLRTNRFEAFRVRMGRRSRGQIADLDWTGDPSAVLDHLVVFGPSSTDIRE